MRRFDDRAAVVTGGGSGIGEATAHRLASEGAAVVIADIDLGAAERVVTDIEAAGGRALACEVDMAVEADVERMVATTVEAFGSIDMLHNNAAGTGPDMVGRDKGVLELTTELFDRTIAVNTRGPMIACRAAVPHMIERGRGSIINMITLHALSGDDRFTAYAMSKAALIALTRSVATQFGRQGIRCNAVAPGATITPALEREMDADQIAKRARHCLTPALGKPDNVADLVAFLFSDESAFITGEVVRVDGGALSHLPAYADRLPADA